MENEPISGHQISFTKGTCGYTSKGATQQLQHLTTPRTELALLISLSSLFLSTLRCCCPSRPLQRRWLMPQRCLHSK
ncbi:hypothetical protein MHYP_G00257290 [Metynnis hypsauchen]